MTALHTAFWNRLAARPNRMIAFVFATGLSPFIVERFM